MDRKSNSVWAGTAVAGALLGAIVGAAPRPHADGAAQVSVKLSEWSVALSQASIAPLFLWEYSCRVQGLYPAG